MTEVLHSWIEDNNQWRLVKDNDGVQWTEMFTHGLKQWIKRDGKPCDEPCKKCGSHNINRKLIKKWYRIHSECTLYWELEESLESCRFYKMEEREGMKGFMESPIVQVFTAIKDHINHTCNSCSNFWRGDVLNGDGETK